MSELDVVEQGRPPLRPAGRLAVGLVVIGALVVALVLWGSDRGGDHRPAAGSTAAKASPHSSSTGLSCLDGDTGETYPDGVGRDAIGLALTAASPTAAVNRVDAGAALGPWTVVVREPDSWLGTVGAVITYPVAAPDETVPGVSVGAVVGRAQAGVLTWPLGEGWAQVRGDRTLDDLIDIASATRVVDGRPAVGPVPPYQAMAALPYRSPLISESRYAPADLGVPGRVLGGLVYAGLVRGGGFEDRLYTTAQRPAVALVHGRVAVLSGVLGGDATLAWEVTDGVIAYLGYSGTAPSTDTTCALIQLARNSRLVGSAEWNRIAPQRTDAINDFS